ncbi:hypothetical protein IPV09_11980 [Tessaracoccus sp. SD287]|uniref:hypothetical protein n=1 Tax=Tessaracoccus sp. SD287 TaxID=2782008 RepID=UPI001A956F24|nr:hypothetical protein [Tessaracoccus sp. SD287]MBO1032056.1 hypothetical protein [Tessaracoccus sp. SD287]
MAESEWLRRSAHVEDIRPDPNDGPEPDAVIEIQVRHHCHRDHEHRSWIAAPAALSSRVPPYTVAVLVNREQCDVVRFDRGEAVNTAGLLAAAAAIAVILLIVVLVIII